MTPDQIVPIFLERLRVAHPGARYELDWTTPLELLVATILAAQCTDERVNRVTATPVSYTHLTLPTILLV